jgi:hypothetical protein
VDTTGGLAISWIASGGGTGSAGEDSAAVWLTNGEEAVEALTGLAGEAGIVVGGIGLAGVRLSDGDAETALTTVTRRARRVAAGLVAVPTRRTSPPRSSA